jgi:predicted choloylglycine hydrolase
MMNTIKTMLISSFLLFSLFAAHTGQAGVGEAVMDRRINTTIAHLESARKALAANERDTAQEHMKAAGQSSKEITGGSFEVKAQRGSRSIANARRLVREGDNTGAAAVLEEAEGIYKSLLQPAKSGGRGGLN